MRLLCQDGAGGFTSEEYIGSKAVLPFYAILSHTWGSSSDEVSFRDLQNDTGSTKSGFQKLLLCGDWAHRYGLRYFWADTCCIDKANHAELSEAIISMYDWYRRAVICFVYLADVSMASATWKEEIKRCRWFTRGWTLQELVAPPRLVFFDHDGRYIGDRISLEKIIHDVTRIPQDVLRGGSVAAYSIDERFSWAKHRATDREEDAAYSLFGLFDVSMPVLYGEGRRRALRRLREGIEVPGHDDTTDTAVEIDQEDNETRPSMLIMPADDTTDTAVEIDQEDDEARLLKQGLRHLSKALQCIVLEERHVNRLKIDRHGDTVVSLPKFRQLNLVCPPEQKRSTFSSSPFRLADTLNMLPGQKHSRLTEWHTTVLKELGAGHTSYRSLCSKRGLLELISQHFASVEIHDGSLHISTTLGRFVIFGSTQDAYAHFDSDNQASSPYFLADGHSTFDPSHDLSLSALLVKAHTQKDNMLLICLEQFEALVSMQRICKKRIKQIMDFGQLESFRQLARTWLARIASIPEILHPDSTTWESFSKIHKPFAVVYDLSHACKNIAALVQEQSTPIHLADQCGHAESLMKLQVMCTHAMFRCIVSPPEWLDFVSAPEFNVWIV